MGHLHRAPASFEIGENEIIPAHIFGAVVIAPGNEHLLPARLARLALDGPWAVTSARLGHEGRLRYP